MYLAHCFLGPPPQSRDADGIDGTDGMGWGWVDHWGYFKSLHVILVLNQVWVWVTWGHITTSITEIHLQSFWFNIKSMRVNVGDFCNWGLHTAHRRKEASALWMFFSCKGLHEADILEVREWRNAPLLCSENWEALPEVLSQDVSFQELTVVSGSKISYVALDFTDWCSQWAGDLFVLPPLTW